MRAHCNIARYLILITAISCGVLVAQATESTQVPHGLIVAIDGPIGPAVSEHVGRAITRANEEQDELVILRIDTPGGLDTSMRDIIKMVLSSNVPIIGFVSPSGARAASAGTYILYATHVAAMSPATNLGAATPIAIGGAPRLPIPDKNPDGTDNGPSHPMPQDAGERKAINDAVAYIRGLAERRGRNADWAEVAVREGASLSAERALMEGVVDVVVPDMPALLDWLDGQVIEIGGEARVLNTASMHLEQLEPSWRTQLLAIITNPTVAYMLLMVGIYGLLLEGYHPGAIFPGVIGAICLLVAMFAFQILPVNMAGLALIVLGLILIMAEAFVPSFGVLGFGGIVAFVIGSVILMDSNVPGYQVPLGMIAAMAVGATSLIVLTVVMLMRSRQQLGVTGDAAILGAVGQATEDFSPIDQGYAGMVWLDGEQWRAICAEPVKAGQTLRVRDRSGLVITVQPVN